jgi:hypothetical protein
MTRIKNRNHLNLLVLFVFGMTVISGCKDKITPPPPPPVAVGSILLVGNYGSGSGYLSAVDLNGGTVRLGIAGLGDTPNDILFANDRLYIVNSGSQDMNILAITDSNVVSQVDTVDLRIGGNRNPMFAVIADNRQMYVSNFVDNTLTQIDTSTRVPGAFYLLTYQQFVGRGPQDMIAYQDKIFICLSGYVSAGVYDPGVVAIFSTTSNRVIDTLHVGLNPQYMAMDNNRLIHVVCTGNYDDVPGSIYIIDSRTDQVTRIIDIGGSPGDIAVAGRYAYIAAGGWTQGGTGKVYRYDIQLGQILNGPNTPIEVSLGASRIVAAEDGSVYVSCSMDNKVDHVVGVNRQESWLVGDGPGPMLLIER